MSVGARFSADRPAWRIYGPVSDLVRFPFASEVVSGPGAIMGIYEGM